MILPVLAAYWVMFIALGVGTMIAIRAQVEHESDSPELGDVPESIAVKRHRATGWRSW